MLESEGISAENLQRAIEFSNLQKKNASDLKSYYETMKLMKELQANVIHEKKMQLKIEKKLLELEKDEEKLIEKGYHTNHKIYKQLLKDRDLEKANLRLVESKLKTHEDILKTTSESLNANNLIVASARTMGKLIGSAGQKLKVNLGYYLEQQKSVKVAGLNMGILSKQSASFANTLYKSSMSTNLIGVDTKMLAKMQSDYSEELGRSVQFSESSNNSMAELAKGTALGAEGAARFVADMDNFGISAEGSQRTVDTLLNTAHKMGVNASASTKKLAENLKLANKFNFKDGIKGLGEMVALSLKYKVNLDSVSGFAESVQDIEGAVEAAAKLNVLGGNWAKLGDPFELLYKSRNDLKGFTEDIIKATDITGEFDKNTGEFKITALELSRLREVAKATGIDFESLSQTTKEFAKNSKIKAKLVGYNTEDKEFLSSLATFSEKNKDYVIRLDGKDIPIDEMKKLNRLDIQNIKDQQEGSKERAKNAMTFDETWEGMKNTLKSAFLPGFEAFAQAVSTGLVGFTKYMQDNGFLDKIVAWGKNIGELAASAVKWISDNPIKSMGIGITALIAKESIWLLRGTWLGLGFNKVASMGSSSSWKPGQVGEEKGMLGKIGKLMGPIMSIASGVGIGGLASEASGKKSTTTGSIIGGLSGAAGWAGAFAFAPESLGLSLLVPLIASGIGKYIGDSYSQENTSSNPSTPGSTAHDFIARPGADPIKFSSADTLVGLKKDGGIGKALVSNSVGDSGSKNMQHSFTNAIKIEGNINVNSSDGNMKIDMNNPLFIRSLTKLIQEELSKNIGGGKLSSSPA